MKQNRTCILQIFLGLFGVSVLFANPLQVIAMPEYERLQPIVTNVKAPTAVALDVYGNLYIIESSQNTLRMYDSDGEYIRTLSGLEKPISVAVDDRGRIFVGNKEAGNVEVYDQDFVLIGKLGKGDGEIIQPEAIAIDRAGTVYIADSGDDTIKVYDPEGALTFSFGSSGDGDGQFHFPASIAIDDLSDELIISDLQMVRSMLSSHAGARVQIFDLQGRFKRSFGVYGAEDGKFIKPLGVEVDEKGRFYVSDAYLNVVHVFDNAGIFLGTLYDLEHPLRTPLGMAFGSGNRLFIASLTTSQVEVYRITDLPPGPGPGPGPGSGVPEPSTLLLFGSGLVGILALGRKKLTSIGQSCRE